MASVYTEMEQEGVVNSAVVMGFLNRFMWEPPFASLLEVSVRRGSNFHDALWCYFLLSRNVFCGPFDPLRLFVALGSRATLEGDARR